MIKCRICIRAKANKRTRNLCKKCKNKVLEIKCSQIINQIMAGGRPTKYTKELGQAICKRIAEGNSVRTIVKDDKMPSSSTIFNWLLDEDKKAFLEQYETARNVQAETMFEELLEIADNTEILEINKARLRVDTRKWYLSKVLPKKFGDKMDVTSDGKQLPTPIIPLK